MGGGWALLGLLLLAPGPHLSLRCPLCDPGGCRDVSCPSPNATCRRTTLTTWRGGLELRREEGGCDVSGPPDVVITFRSHGEVVTLREERRPAPPGPPPGSPVPHRPLLCVSCDGSDGSCERPLLGLRCPRAGDACVELSEGEGLRGEGPKGGGAKGGRSQREGEGLLRGCGSAGPCREPLALETGGGRQVALKCCWSDGCEPEPDPAPSGLRCWACDGPEPHGCTPQVLTCGGGRTQCVTAQTYGPSGEPWLVLGCATPSWCQRPLGLGGLRGGALPQCCGGALCNSAPWRSGGSAAAPLPHSGLLVGLLLLAPRL
ncbi:urokinase plasminogen activator surface receptor [Neopsephotus bourkii]|uniref:urokinase plasminogen activator surface receptor n=1 Tax=Neopsephotus bourkii TaxID=309878 RepID=UPI002AA5560B|nr:urokinase plasminogen activator surface receptor [Neopsephotus bourkii]